jgi:hypothetical protein
MEYTNKKVILITYSLYDNKMSRASLNINNTHLKKTKEKEKRNKDPKIQLESRNSKHCYKTLIVRHTFPNFV